MSDPLPPFSCTFTPEVPELLNKLNCTVALSTYQAGKVIFIGAVNDEKMIQLPRNFDTAMGLAMSPDKMAVACKNDLQVLRNSPEMAPNYPPKPKTYDALFLPRATYYTGGLTLHDMAFVNGELYAINTLFSCLSKINDEYSFMPLWKPSFINELVPEDQCHLNGMAIQDDKIEYVTALGNTNTRQGWRENKINGGVLIHVPTNKIILDELSMPHSPRVYNNELYLLQSAQGQLIKVDIDNESYEIVTQVGGFARGMAKVKDYLFVGVSKLRHTHSVFADLPIAKTSFAGIVIIYLPMGSIAGKIEYKTSVDEIYDVKIIEGYKRPGILNTSKDAHQLAVTTPTDNYWAMPEEEEKKEKEKT